jgi:hypothetical protein
MFKMEPFIFFSFSSLLVFPVSVNDPPFTQVLKHKHPIYGILYWFYLQICTLDYATQTV